MSEGVQFYWGVCQQTEGKGGQSMKATETDIKLIRKPVHDECSSRFAKTCTSHRLTGSPRTPTNRGGGGEHVGDKT